MLHQPPIPSQKSIRKVFDIIDSYFIVKRAQAEKGKFRGEVIDQWEEEIKPVADYLNWLAYKDEKWYKESPHY